MSELEQLFHQVQGDPDDLKQAIESLFNADSIKMKTVLSHEEIVAVAVALTFAETYKIEVLEHLVHTLLQLKVSKQGLGWKTLRDVLTTRLSQPDLDEDNTRHVRRLMGQ